MLPYIILFSCLIPLGVWLRFFTPRLRFWFGHDRALHHDEDWRMVNKLIGICCLYSGLMLTGSSICAVFFPELRLKYIILMLIVFTSASIFVVEYFIASNIHSE
jgi:hypothetical protein